MAKKKEDALTAEEVAAAEKKAAIQQEKDRRDELYKMKLHDAIVLGTTKVGDRDGITEVIRVPGGWMYILTIREYLTEPGTGIQPIKRNMAMSSTSVFVPFNVEFNK